MESWQRQLIGLTKIEGSVSIRDASKATGRSEEEIREWVATRNDIVLDGDSFKKYLENAVLSDSDTNSEQIDHDDEEEGLDFLHDDHPAERWF